MFYTFRFWWESLCILDFITSRYMIACQDTSPKHDYIQVYDCLTGYKSKHDYIQALIACQDTSPKHDNIQVYYCLTEYRPINMIISKYMIACQDTSPTHDYIQVYDCFPGYKSWANI